MARSGGRLICVIGAVVAIAIAPASSAGAPAPDIPQKAVVRVGDSSIARSTFDRWLAIAAASANLRASSGRAVYDPPKYTRCVARMRRSSRGRAATTTRLKKRCRQEYEGLRDQVLQFLIMERWVTGEAAERGVVVPAAELEREYRRLKRAAFPKESDFRKFLKQARMTAADARFQIAFNTLDARLRDLAVAGAPPVTDAEVATHYDAHAARFAEPETRDIRIVLTKTRGRADAARAALERGQTWRHVARKYSIDRASSGRAGLIRDVAAGSSEEALDKALFRAPRLKLRGPVRTRFGYYVFKVLEITPARQRTLAQAAPEIREELTAEREQQAAEAYGDDLRAKWLPRTTCRAGFVMSLCANAPPSSATTPPTTTSPPPVQATVPMSANVGG